MSKTCKRSTFIVPTSQHADHLRYIMKNCSGAYNPINIEIQKTYPTSGNDTHYSVIAEFPVQKGIYFISGITWAMNMHYAHRFDGLPMRPPLAL
jgi:hypothetical protein